MKRETTTCAAIGCQMTIFCPLLMCVNHWRQVPVATRRNLWACFHRVRRDPQAWADHQRAVVDAVEAVRLKQHARKDKADAATRPLF